MQIKGLRVQVILIAFVLTVIVILSGQHFFQKLTVEQPLLKSLKATANVQDVTLERQKEQLVVTVTLNGTAQLGQTYGQIDTRIREKLGEKPYRIKINDQRTAQLEQTYYQISPYVQEAISRGNFWSMFAKVEAELTRLGIARHALTVDSENVYVFLGDDKGYLYEVIPRTLVAKNGQDAAQGN